MQNLKIIFLTLIAFYLSLELASAQSTSSGLPIGTYSLTLIIEMRKKFKFAFKLA